MKSMLPCRLTSLRTYLSVALALSAADAYCAQVGEAAQAYPTRPVRLIVPYPPGVDPPARQGREAAGARDRARASRLAHYPDLPTFTEAGVRNYEVNAWYSVHAPAGVPREIVTKVNRELLRILELPDIRERLKQLGSEGAGTSPEEFAKFVRAESAKYAKAIREAGVKVE